MADQENTISDPATDTGPHYSIKVRSYEAVNVPLIGSAVHHEIIFEQDGQVLLSLNGNPWKRETGQPNFPGHGDNNTLRVNAMAGKTIADLDTDGKFPIVTEQTLYSDHDSLKFSELVGRAAEASVFINSYNMDYIMVDPFRKAQNSNSVAHTLTHAMGLQYSPGTEQLWAPGHGRLLLPSGFKSDFDSKENDVPSQSENTIARLISLSDENISAQVLKDPKHPNRLKDSNIDTPTFFNPAPKPAPEIPLSVQSGLLAEQRPARTLYEESKTQPEIPVVKPQNLERIIN